jgi:hypothetical protein
MQPLETGLAGNLNGGVWYTEHQKRLIVRQVEVLEAREADLAERPVREHMLNLHAHVAKPRMDAESCGEDMVA